jgi:hypothetical protein
VDLAHELLSPNVQLFSTDPSGCLKCGTLPPQVYATVDFGCSGNWRKNFDRQREYNQGHGPYVCSEFYTGWLDHWGEKHHTTSTECVVNTMDGILALGGNLNFYMYFGGTNFGLLAGANGGGNSFQPDPTSYDYDSPLSEAGDMRWKWDRIRDISRKYLGEPPRYDVSNSTKVKYSDTVLTASVTLWKALDFLTEITKDSDDPITMELLDVAYGFTIYKASSRVTAGSLTLPQVHDRAWVFVDRAKQCLVDGHHNEKPCNISAGDLEILVENEGRINFGGGILEHKGLIQTPKIGNTTITGWKNIGLSFTKLKDLEWSEPVASSAPAFYRGFFEVNQIGDTWVNVKGWTKGMIWVNGFCLGRHWSIGPQQNYFCPKALLHSGQNEIILFELENVPQEKKVTFDDTPQLG